MARNVSSKFTLEEGFDQEIENLHHDKNESAVRANDAPNGKNANSTNSVNSVASDSSTKNSENTNSAESDNRADNTENNGEMINATTSAEGARNFSSSFDPAAEAEFIAKSSLHDDSKAKRITIQFNRDIYEYIKRESRIRGLSINNFVRMIILSYMSVPGNKHYIAF